MTLTSIVMLGLAMLPAAAQATTVTLHPERPEQVRPHVVTPAPPAANAAPAPPAPSDSPAASPEPPTAEPVEDPTADSPDPMASEPGPVAGSPTDGPVAGCGPWYMCRDLNRQSQLAALELERRQKLAAMVASEAVGLISGSLAGPVLCPWYRAKTRGVISVMAYWEKPGLASELGLTDALVAKIVQGVRPNLVSELGQAWAGVERSCLNTRDE